MALDRAVKAGRLLAHVLLARASAPSAARPVTLVGYGMGARVVFHCLLELVRAGAASGVVEHAVLLGAPVTVRPERWAMARAAVAGRFVNGYSRADWVLAVVFRASTGFVRPAGGLCPVPVAGVENVNLGALVKGHLDYGDALPEIVELIGLGG